MAWVVARCGPSFAVAISAVPKSGVDDSRVFLGARRVVVGNECDCDGQHPRIRPEARRAARSSVAQGAGDDDGIGSKGGLDDFEMGRGVKINDGQPQAPSSRFTFGMTTECPALVEGICDGEIGHDAILTHTIAQPRRKICQASLQTIAALMWSLRVTRTPALRALFTTSIGRYRSRDELTTEVKGGEQDGRSPKVSWLRKPIVCAMMAAGAL